jgi:lipoprotein-anchoring transpeptidase ErfK/SrfK
LLNGNRDCARLLHKVMAMLTVPTGERSMKTANLMLQMLGCAVAGTCAQAAATTSVAVPATLAPEMVNDAALMTAVQAGDKGAAVLRAQILLDRARFSPGELDAVYGSNMRHAIAGFQASRRLPVSGTMDAATWAALGGDSAPVLVSMTLGAADVAGPFKSLPPDMMARSKLDALGYSSSLEALGEKFHASPALLQQLNPGRDFGRAGEQLVVPAVEAATPMPVVAKVVVDRSDSTVALLDETGKVVAQYPASTGSKHDPLPIGDWKIKGVGKNPVFHYNPKLFWDAKAKDARTTLAAGPNNPVGVVWVDLSMDHYGIHGTPEPSKVGKTESHGCIRLTNWSALALSQAVKPGMTATLQE